MRYFVILIFVFLIFNSCEEPLNFNVPENENFCYVIEGGFTTQFARHKIEISKSTNFLTKGEKKYVKGANVFICSDNDTIILTEINDGIYYTPFTRAEIGKTYELNVIIGETIIKAHDTVRECMTIDSILIVKGKDFIDSKNAVDGYYFYLNAQEKAGVGDYYMIDIYINNKLYTDSLGKVMLISDGFIDGKYIRNMLITFIPDADIPDTATVTFRLSSISEKYFNYFLDILSETYWRGSPWDGPPANAKNNLSNNALGFFYTADVKDYKIKFIKTPD